MSRLPRPSLSTPWCDPWQPELIGTLIFVVRSGQVLLIHKKTGHGAGKINGPGGKWDVGESLLQCAQRETLEEVGVVVGDIECRAEMRFVERNGPQWLGFAFVAQQCQGEPVETREARPFWCAVEDIPYDQMWPDDAIWLPQILDRPAGQSPIVMDFLFNDGDLPAHSVASAPSIYERLNSYFDEI